MGSARRLALVIVALATLSGTVVPVGAVEGLVTLTLTGPSTVTVGQAEVYAGRLAVDSIGVPAEKVVVEVDGAVVATAATGTDGSYAVELTQDAYGDHTVQAVAYGGTQLEVRSPVLAVEAVAPHDETSPTDLHEASEFLYTGPSAVQTGVAPGTIEPARVAVLRGAVTDVAGEPLSDVAVTVQGHPEFGETTTSAGGIADLAVNGGGRFTVRYDKAGFIPAEREVSVGWREYGRLPDVRLVAYDPAVTTVTLSASSPMQVARGSEVSDEDGTRQATLLFPEGTRATMRLADGTTQPLTTLDVRATEFTVGDTGPEAMPAHLPEQSAYTYAVEFSVDEAVAADAAEVTFSRPLPTYVENFLDFPVGMAVPTGYYDREIHAWVAAPNGRIVEVVGVTDGRADLDVDGDGAADTGSVLSELDVTDDEREQVAELYPVGQSLWRVPVPHFTPWDHNWPYGLPPGAVAPGQELPQPDASGQCTKSGSVIGCENQTLGESVGIAGTPLRLHYDSERMPGRLAGRSLRIPLSGPELPNGLRRIELTVDVGGRQFAYSFDPPTPDLVHTFVWDGEDAYGRALVGTQQATVSIGYVYEAVYYQPADWGASFGQVGSAPISGSRARQEITVLQRYQADIGTLSHLGRQSIGGWTLSIHHAYDRDAGSLHLGDGTVRRASAVFPTIATAAGNGAVGPGGDGTYTGDGGPATDAGLGLVRGVATGPDGSLFIADTGNGVVRRVTPDGIIETFAGGGLPPVGNGDGGPATDAELFWPVAVAVAGDGTVYISDPGERRIRRVDPDGTITTLAGGGAPADGLGDGGPARAARLPDPRGIAVGSSGTVYVADTSHDRIRQITADGTITTLAGGGTPADGLGDGLPGPQAALNDPYDVAVDPDGVVFVADTSHHRLRRIGRDGTISTFAGTGLGGKGGDGGPATSADVGAPYSVTVDRADGTVYAAQRIERVIRRVGADGIIATAAGTGRGGYAGDNGAPGAAEFADPQAVAVGPDGTVYVADSGNFRIRRVKASVEGFATDDFVVPSADGAVLYQFDVSGRHLATRDALTGVTLWRFGYDDQHGLVSVTDTFGNATTIEWDTDGRPTGVVSPDGLRTILTVNGDGYLATVTNPAAETVGLGYTTGGLLASLTTPRNEVHSYRYDELGRLVEDRAPDGKTTTLARVPADSGVAVAVTSAEGRTTTYTLDAAPGGGQRRTTTSPDGARTEAVTTTAGTITVTAPDGTVTTAEVGPDPRWGMQTPLPVRATVVTPDGRTVTTTTARTVTLSDPLDPLTLQTQTDTVVTTGETTTRHYDAATSTITTTTPEGRQAVTSLNASGQVTRVRNGGLAPVDYRYDERGRLTGTTQGDGADARTGTVVYDDRGFVESTTGPEGHTTTFARDPVGRILEATRPDDARSQFTYDASGNLTELTPAGRPTHRFDYGPADIVDAYRPPAIDAADPATTYRYNLDRQPTATTRPDGQTVALSYDGFGRPATTSFSGGEITYGYDAASRLETVTAPGGEGLRYGYDGMLLTDATAAGTVNTTVRHGYDADLRLNALTVGTAAPVGYSYTGDGHIATAGALTASYDDTTGQLATTALGAVASSHAYNTFGEPTHTAVTAAGVARYDVTDERDPLGRVTRRTETVAGTTRVLDYRYDELGQLVEVTADGTLLVGYAYDPNGNRTTTITPAGTVTASYDDQDRLLTSGDTGYSYTANGELREATGPAGTTGYRYDELGNLTQVVLPDTTTIDYVADASGRRIARQRDGVTTHRWVYGSHGQPVGEVDADGAVTTVYVYATRGHVPDYMVRGGVTYRLVTDQLGSPRLVIDTATGTVVQQLDYDPYGNVTVDTNPGFQPFGFAGGLYDHETGLVRFGVRDYDASVGQWTTKDPIGFHGGDTNLYAYVGNDPVNRIDPSGRAFMLAVAAVWAVVEIGLAIADAISTAQTVLDECASSSDKLMAVGLFGLGALAPGGGGSTAARYGDDVAAAARAPGIKPGASGGPTAGQRFSSSVRDAAKAENPTATCVFCRTEGVATHVDHAIPRVRGGDATLENAQLACPWCNVSKGPRDFPVNPPPSYEGRWPPPWWSE